MNNDKIFLTHVLNTLLLHDIRPILFGGWAEEIHGKYPWIHSDIDLIVAHEDINKIESLTVNEVDWKEIVQKRFPHKRALEYRGIMIEFLLYKIDNGRAHTNFFNIYKYEWPDNLSNDIISLGNLSVHVASKKELHEYRLRHAFVRSAYSKYIEIAKSSSKADVPN